MSLTLQACRKGEWPTLSPFAWLRLWNVASGGDRSLLQWHQAQHVLATLEHFVDPRIDLALNVVVLPDVSLEANV